MLFVAEQAVTITPALIAAVTGMLTAAGALVAAIVALIKAVRGETTAKANTHQITRTADTVDTLTKKQAQLEAMIGPNVPPSSG